MRSGSSPHCFVGGQQLLGLDALLGRDVVSVAQQRPARGLHRPPRGSVGARAIGLVHPHSMDDFAPVFSHSVEKVVDELSIGALAFELHIKGRSHVHRYDLGALTAGLAE